MKGGNGVCDRKRRLRRIVLYGENEKYMGHSPDRRFEEAVRSKSTRDDSCMSCRVLANGWKEV